MDARNNSWEFEAKSQPAATDGGGIHMTEAKKNWAESRQLRVGAMLPTAQRRPDLRITGEDQSGAPPGGGSTQNRP